MNGILRKIFRGLDELRTYEIACLIACIEQLSPEARRIFEEQLTAFKYVQRSSREKMVIFSIEDAKFN